MKIPMWLKDWRLDQFNPAIWRLDCPDKWKQGTKPNHVRFLKTSLKLINQKPWSLLSPLCKSTHQNEPRDVLLSVNSWGSFRRDSFSSLVQVLGDYKTENRIIEQSITIIKLKSITIIKLKSITIINLNNNENRKT